MIKNVRNRFIYNSLKINMNVFIQFENFFLQYWDLNSGPTP
jgi:hypothetical protein